MVIIQLINAQNFDLVNISSSGARKKEWALVYNPHPLFDQKIVYSYVIQVADSESDFGLHGRSLISEVFAFYYLKIAQGRPGRRGHVHLGNSQNVFEGF